MAQQFQIVMAVLLLYYSLQEISSPTSNIWKVGDCGSIMTEFLPPIVSPKSGGAAHSAEQACSLDELTVDTPNPFLLQAVYDQPVQQVPAEQLQYKNIHNDVNPDSPNDWGIQMRSRSYEISTTQNNECGQTERGFPVSMENIPCLASWLGHIPEGFCKEDGHLMKLMKNFNLTNDYRPEFVVNIGKILNSVRVHRNEKAHKNPKMCKMSAQIWDTLLKELEACGYVTSDEGQELTKFYNLLRKGKWQLTTN